MAKTIVWTRRSRNKFNNVIAYLETEWGESTAGSFVQQTYFLIDLLSEHPELGSIENNERNIRGVLVTKHNRLFYRIDEDRIILLNFFDNRQEPKRKRY